MDRFNKLCLDVLDLESTCYAFADQAKRGLTLGPDISLLKVWGTETCQRICDFLLEVAGTDGGIMGKIGISGCDMGISYFLPRLVGPSVAAELMMSGRKLDADRALTLGLVSGIEVNDELEAKGHALAQDMLRVSPLGLRLTKEGLNAAIDAPSLEQAIVLEDRGQVLCTSSGLLEKGVAEFFADRY